MADEPLTLTLEEAMRLLSQKQRDVWLEVGHQGWTVHEFDSLDESFHIVALAPTWPEAVSAALGRPVIESDSVEDTKAIVREMFRLADAARSLHDPSPVEIEAAADAAWGAYQRARLAVGMEAEGE